MAPTKVPRLTSVLFTTLPVVGTTYAATAETPKAKDPKKFR
jgi:hypothetical protein